MNQNQLTSTEIKYLKIFDRRDIRIRIERTTKNHSKFPLIENWTKYYSEPWTIAEILAKGYNYGIRTGKQIGNYYNIVIDLDDLWAKQRIKDTRYIETNKGIHRYILLKELPKPCYLVNKDGQRIGELHSLGRQIVGIGSIHEQGTRYTLKGRSNVKFSLTFEKLTELQNFLTQRNIFTTPWGKTGTENIQNLELFCQKPLKTYQQKKQELEELSKANKQKLHICYICLVSFPEKLAQIKTHLHSNNHLQKLKIYQNKAKSKKNFTQK